MACWSVSRRFTERCFVGGSAHGSRCSVALGSFSRISPQAARSVSVIPPSYDNHRHTVLGARPGVFSKPAGVRSSYMMGIPWCLMVLA